MRRSDLHTKISELLKTVPDDALEDVFNYLKEIKEHSPSTINLSHNLKKILTEDKELLKRLAQ